MPFSFHVSVSGGAGKPRPRLIHFQSRASLISEPRKQRSGVCPGPLHFSTCREQIMKFNIPTMHGIIERRMLVNFRVRPDVVRPLLPEFFRPKLVNGWAMAGICLIRLKNMRPHGFPAACGLTSQNAAHRIAVEWDEAGIT